MPTKQPKFRRKQIRRNCNTVTPLTPFEHVRLLMYCQGNQVSDKTDAVRAALNLLYEKHDTPIPTVKDIIEIMGMEWVIEKGVPMPEQEVVNKKKKK